MNMTHYMELLATNQPWNLLLFMAVPVMLAETVAITELFVLFRRATSGALVAVNRAASIVGGAYFIGVVAYLVPNAVVPITAGGAWRGPADVIAVGSYLLCVVPLVGMALLDLRWIGARLSDSQRMAWHAACVAAFLVVAHVAMIFGMLDPTVLGGAAGGSHATH